MAVKEKNQLRIGSLPRILSGHERGNLKSMHETGPHRMAEARPEKKIYSEILRSRPGVCC